MDDYEFLRETFRRGQSAADEIESFVLTNFKLLRG